MVAIMPGNQNSSAIKRADRGSVEAPPDLPTQKVQREDPADVANDRVVAKPRVSEVPSRLLPAISSDGRRSEFGLNGYDFSDAEEEVTERNKHPSIQVSYHNDEFQEEPIILHPDMIDEDTEEELDYQISELSQSKVMRESGQGENHSRPLSESNNDDALDVVKDPWAAVASLVDPDNPEDQLNQAMAHKRNKSRKSKEDSFVQRFHKSRLNSSRNRRSSTGSKSSNKSSWSASSQSSTSTATGKKRGRPPKEKPPVLFCYRCTLPFQSFVEWREHAVYKHIAAKDPYPIVEMNYIDPSKLRSGITLEKYSDLFSEDHVGSDEDLPMPTLQMFTEETEPANDASTSDSTLQKISLPDLSTSTQSQHSFTSANAEISHVDSSKAENSLNSEESEYPKEQLKLRFSMNKKAGTYVVRQSSVESVKSPLAVASNSSGSSPVGIPDVSDSDLSMETSTTSAFNNNVVIKNSNVSGLPDNLPELVGDNATNDNFTSEATTATPILEARLKLTNTEKFSEENLPTISSQSVIIRSSDSNRLSTLSEDEKVPSGSNDTISEKLSKPMKTKSRKTRKNRKVSVDVGICVEDMLNVATEAEKQGTEKKQTDGEQELNLLVTECAEEMIKMAESMQNKEVEDAQIREDVADCVRDVIRKTKEAEREAKKDKQILEDVRECVGDVVQQAVSIEAELDAILDNDYEIMLEKATELSRKASPFHQNFIPTRRTGKQLQLINHADDTSSEPQDMISKDTLPGRHTTPIESPDVSKTKDQLMADSDVLQKDSGNLQDPATPPLIQNDENSNDSYALRIACDEDSEMERLDTEIPEIDQSQKVTSLECENGVKDQETISEINHDQPALNRSTSTCSTETIPTYEESKDSKLKESNEGDRNSPANGDENNPASDTLADDEEEVDDFQCHLCKKVFESDEEVSQHFSNEHVRISNVVSLEPESPYPATPAEPEHEDMESDNGSCITEASQERASLVQRRRRSEEVQESSSRSSSSDALTELLLQKTSNNVRTADTSNLQHMFTIRGGTVLQTNQSQLREGDYQTAQRMASSQPDVNRLHQQVQMALAAEMRAAPTASVPGIMVGFQRPKDPPVAVNVNRSALNQTNQQQQQNMMGTGPRPPPQLTQRPPQPSRQPPPSQSEILYSNSLRNALTSGQSQQVYNNPNISIGRSPRMPQGSIGARPQLRPTSVSASSSSSNPTFTQHHLPSTRYPVEAQGQGQGTRPVSISSIQERSRDPNRPVGTIAQTIAHEQHLLNEAREVQRQREAAQRLLLQQRISAPVSTQSAVPQLSRLQYSQSTANQQSSVQQPREANERAQIISRIHGQPQLVISGQKRSNSIETRDANDVRSNKQPRLDNQTVLSSSAEITISHRIIPGTNTSVSPGLSNSNASQANQGSGVNNNSVRIGNSITLSVCPGEETRPGQSAIRSNHQILYSNNRTPAAGATNPQNASVLAVRGVTVASHSPPNQSKSPVNPTPSNSPVVSQNYSGVIQRGPGTVSPQRNPSPPVVNAPIRGGAAQGQQQHNFAVPRPPTTIRTLSQHQAQQQVSGNSPYSVNSSLERPNRPPTVDLTDDDIQAHHLNQQMAIRLHNERQMALEQHRRLQQSAQVAQATQANNSALRAPRPALCNMCNSNFPSIQALDEHKRSYHGVVVNPSHLRVANSTIPTAIRANPNSGIQIREVRSMNPSQVPGPVRAPPPTLQSNASALMRSQAQARSTNSPTRPVQQQSGQRSATPPGKYFYIPLLDLSRVDESKMRKLEELGISCVVPLQGGNSMMSHMGIPVMNLRSENNLFSNHIPWDSVIPMGPVHQPATSSSNNNAVTASANIRSTERDGGSYQQQQQQQQQTQQAINRQQQYQHNSTQQQQQHSQSVNQHNITLSGAGNGNNRVIITRPAGYHQ